MAGISKVIRLSQKLRDTEPSMLTLCIGFVGRRFPKKYCLIHHAIVSAILEAILQKMATIFNVMRVIFETMRQRNVTVVSTHISYGQYNSDSALLRASHNCGHNLPGCWLWLFVLNNNWYNGWCRICKCFFTFNKHRWWDQSVHPFNRYWTWSIFQFRVRPVLTWRIHILIWYLPQSSTNKSRLICTGPC